MERKTGKVREFFNGDVIFLFVCLGFCVAMLVATRSLHDESATLVPRLFGTLGVVFALLAIVFRAASFFWGGEKKKVRLGASRETPEGVQFEAGMNLYLAIALAVVYIFLAEVVGFIVSTVVIVFAYLWFARYRRVALGLTYAVAISLFLYFLFYSVLKTNLPEGLVSWPWERFIR